MIFLKKFLIALSFVFLLNTIQAQIIGDMPYVKGESRNSLKICYEISQKCNINLESQIRFNYSSEYFNQFNQNATFEYNFYKSIKFTIGGQYKYKSITDYGITHFEKHLKTIFFLSNDFKFNRFKFDMRIGFHDYYNISHSQKYNMHEKSCWRIKTEVAYNIKKWKLDPFLLFEYFYITASEMKLPKDKYRMDVRPPANKYLLGLGTSFKIKQVGKVYARYLFECEILDWNPTVTHIIDLTYKYTIK